MCYFKSVFYTQIQWWDAYRVARLWSRRMRGGMHAEGSGAAGGICGGDHAEAEAGRGGWVLWWWGVEWRCVVENVACMLSGGCCMWCR